MKNSQQPLLSIQPPHFFNRKLFYYKICKPSFTIHTRTMRRSITGCNRTLIVHVCKESAKKFKENSFAVLRSSINFHLQSVEAKFVSWKCTDPRVSKEVLKCKILPSAISSCFSTQCTKSDTRLSQIMIIFFDWKSVTIQL